MPIAELKPAPYNPRRVLKPDSPAYRKLAASLREFGLVEPLVWNEISGHIVGGHARLRILKEMGVEEIPVSVVQLSLEREKALNVVLNNREAQSRFDPGTLSKLLAELRDSSELKLSGFELSDLPALKLEPVAIVSPVKELDHVEVTLVADKATFERISERLDALVAEFDLVCHVKRY
jgi:ParB-like chromosome segregation protein Spo0J